MKKLTNIFFSRKIFAILAITSLFIGCGDDTDSLGNHLPTVNITQSNKTVNINTQVNLDSVATDIDGDNLTYQWSFLSKPNGSEAVLNTNNTKNSSFIADKEGEYQIKFIAKDTLNATSSDTITITATDPTAINPNSCTIIDSTNARISEDTTWVDSCYRVKNSVRVSDGALLTIKEGTILFFEADTAMEIYGGALTAIGTEEYIDKGTGEIIPAKPIIFTGIQKTVGYWTGVIFYNTNDNRNKVAHSTIEYAKIALKGGNGKNRINISDTTLRNSETYGFSLEGNTIIDKWDRITSTKNKSAGYLYDVNNLSKLNGSGNYIGNKNDYIEVHGGEIRDSDHTWKKLSVPAYFSNDGSSIAIAEQAFVAVEPGATFLCAPEFEIQVRGAFKILGTTTQPIIFKGKQPTAGYWKGITFLSSNDLRNEIGYTTISDASAVDGSNYGGAIWIHDSDTKVKIHDSTISNTIGSAIFFRNGNDNNLVTIENMTYIDIGADEIQYL